MLAIDKDVPLPKHVGSGREPKYPWREMNAGNSFFVPGRTAQYMARVSWAYTKRHGGKFIGRSVTEGCVHGVRIFCVTECNRQDAE